MRNKAIRFSIIKTDLKGVIIMELLLYPLIIIFGLLGAGTSIGFFVYLFIVLASKIKNKIKYGASLYD